MALSFHQLKNKSSLKVSANDEGGVKKKFSWYYGILQKIYSELQESLSDLLKKDAVFQFKELEKNSPWRRNALQWNRF